MVSESCRCVYKDLKEKKVMWIDNNYCKSTSLLYILSVYFSSQEYIYKYFFLVAHTTNLFDRSSIITESRQ